MPSRLARFAPFTLRFEAVHLPGATTTTRWIAPPTHDASGMWSPSLSEATRSSLLLREHDNWITLYSAASLNFSGEIQTQQPALQRRGAEAQRILGGQLGFGRGLLVESRDRGGARLGIGWRACQRSCGAADQSRGVWRTADSGAAAFALAGAGGANDRDLCPQARQNRGGRPVPRTLLGGWAQLHRQHWAERALPWSSCTGSTGNAPQRERICTLALGCSRLRIQHFSHRSRSECLRKVELFRLFDAANNQNLVERYNASAQDGCDWRRTYRLQVCQQVVECQPGGRASVHQSHVCAGTRRA